MAINLFVEFISFRICIDHASFACSVKALGARSAIVSAPDAGDAVAAEGLKGAAEAKPVAACASAAGRCASASAEESCPEVECAFGFVREKSFNLRRA